MSNINKAIYAHHFDTKNLSLGDIKNKKIEDIIKKWKESGMNTSDSTLMLKENTLEAARQYLEEKLLDGDRSNNQLIAPSYKIIPPDSDSKEVCFNLYLIITRNISQTEELTKYYRNTNNIINTINFMNFLEDHDINYSIIQGEADNPEHILLTQCRGEAGRRYKSMFDQDSRVSDIKKIDPTSSCETLIRNNYMIHYASNEESAHKANAIIDSDRVSDFCMKEAIKDIIEYLTNQKELLKKGKIKAATVQENFIHDLDRGEIIIKPSKNESESLDAQETRRSEFYARTLSKQIEGLQQILAGVQLGTNLPQSSHQSNQKKNELPHTTKKTDNKKNRNNKKQVTQKNTSTSRKEATNPLPKSALPPNQISLATPNLPSYDPLTHEYLPQQESIKESLTSTASSFQAKIKQDEQIMLERSQESAEVILEKFSENISFPKKFAKQLPRIGYTDNKEYNRLIEKILPTINNYRETGGALVTCLNNQKIEAKPLQNSNAISISVTGMEGTQSTGAGDLRYLVYREEKNAPWIFAGLGSYHKGYWKPW